MICVLDILRDFPTSVSVLTLTLQREVHVKHILYKEQWSVSLKYSVTPISVSVLAHCREKFMFTIFCIKEQIIVTGGKWNIGT